MKSAVKEAKKRYFQHQVDCLTDKNLTTKKYWIIVHQIYGNKTNHNIPTLLHDNKYFIADRETAELICDHFSITCFRPAEENHYTLPLFTYKIEPLLSDASLHLSLNHIRNIE